MRLNATELLAMREAVALTCERMNACLSNLSSFSTEGDIKTYLGKGFETCFSTIVASGKHAAQPHYDGDTPLLRGFCVIDFGIKHKGICSDITRTVFFGTPSPDELHTYYSLLREHEKLLHLVRPRMRLKYLHYLFRKRLGAKKRLFIHALGHGLGKNVHERCSGKLKPNEVITIEPGLYEKDTWGIRIEDDVLGSGEVLTNSVTRKLIIAPHKAQ